MTELPALPGPKPAAVPAGRATANEPPALPELAAVPWRRPASARSLRSHGRLWTAYTVAHVVPFLAVAVVLIALEPLTVPVAAVALIHAWIIPELYAFRGANVIRPKQGRSVAAEPVALGLLGDLLDHEARALHGRAGLVLEQGAMGTWLVGEGGAVLVSPNGRRVHCFCVTATDSELPPSDRIAHLLLALRTDERGFATVANHAFSGASWRLRRRMDRRARPALDAARRKAS